MNDEIYVLVYKTNKGVTVLGSYEERDDPINLIDILISARAMTISTDTDYNICSTTHNDPNFIFGKMLVNLDEEWMVFRSDLMGD